ncbi:hypothetical protein [Vibrio sp. D431a]|uniref:hypothetical protein n=1 Tax=Vibrio sp. D431a TaxID=2837388 RepID=UPI0025566CF9|nr:hypothetical protein [Vibrio sp. D431a]MDK9789971.1 hypothetical protein [Vibrio sp. D431a]
MSMWVNSNADFNKLVKRVELFISKVAGSNVVKRRDIERELAPAFNYGSDHPTLSSSLKELPKTKEGFIAKRMDTEFSAKLREEFSVIHEASKYNERCQALTSKLVTGLLSSSSSLEALSPNVKEVLSSFHEVAVEQNLSGDRGKALLTVSSLGVIHKPELALDVRRKANMTFSWKTTSIKVEMHLFDYLNGRYEITAIKDIEIGVDKSVITMSEHDRAILSGLFTKTLSSWAQKGAFALTDMGESRLSIETLNAIYRDLMPR